MPSRRDLVSDVLAIGLVVNLAAFVASAIPSTPFDTRELVAVLPYGAVLAGRTFGPWLTSANAPRIRSPRVRPFWLSPFWPRPFWVSPFRLRPFRLRAAVAVLALAGVCQLAALGYGATRPPAANPEQALAGWLADHHLTTGLGTYTEDNVTTLDSGGAVRLRTVSWPRSGRAVPRLYQSSASWYDPRTADANFVVSGTADGAGRPHPPRRDPRLGRPARPHLPVPVIHDHDLEQEPARPAHCPALPPPRRHRPPLSGPLLLLSGTSSDTRCDNPGCLPTCVCDFGYSH